AGAFGICFWTLRRVHVPKRALLRLAWAGLALLALVAILGLIGKLAGLPHGYGGAQDATEAALKAMGNKSWKELRAGTGVDLFCFIPIYVLLGSLAACWLVPGVARDDGPAWKRVLTSRWVIVGFLALAGVADIVETLLFRSSLARLLKDADASL